MLLMTCIWFLCASNSVFALGFDINIRVPNLKRFLGVVAASSITVQSFPQIGIVHPVSAATEVQDRGLSKGSLLKCKAKSNCVSTSSIKSLEKYSQPWFYGHIDESVAWDKLVSAIRSSSDIALVEKDDELHYLRAEAKSAFPPLGIDDVEFLLNPRDSIVTFRSNSREVVFAGTQIVGDGGANRNRIESIRRKVGWQAMGMDSDVDQFLKEMEKKTFIERIQMASQPSDVNFLDNEAEVSPEI